MDTIKKNNSIIRDEIYSFDFINLCYTKVHGFFQNIKECYNKCFTNLVNEAQEDNNKIHLLGRSFVQIINQNMNSLFIKEKYLEPDIFIELKEFQNKYEENLKDYQKKIEQINKEVLKFKSNLIKEKNNFLEAQYQLNKAKLQHCRELNNKILCKGSKNACDETASILYSKRESVSKCEIQFEIVKRKAQKLLQTSSSEYNSNNEFLLNLNKKKQSLLVESFKKFGNCLSEISKIFSNMSGDIQNLISTINNLDRIELENPSNSLKLLLEEVSEINSFEIIQTYKKVDLIKMELLIIIPESKKCKADGCELTHKNSKAFNRIIQKNIETIHILNLVPDILKGQCTEKIKFSSLFKENSELGKFDLYLRHIDSLIYIDNYSSFSSIFSLFNQYLNSLRKDQFLAYFLVPVLFSSQNI